jgi:serine phosphatase RsbU (regulator of sigma subunit)
MAASNPVLLPDWVVQSIDKEPSFRVLTMDGLGWIDPYTGTVTQAPFGHREVALRHLAANRPWITLKPKPLKELLYLRWLHYLRQHLEFVELLRVFRHGLWLNPYTGSWVPGITLVNNQITGETIDDLAHVLGQCDEAQSGKMLERYRLDILIANGPDAALAQTARESKTAQIPKGTGKASRAKTDFHQVKNQFLKMLAKPPRLEGYQIVLQYEPHSIIPRNFYDFISLDRDRLMIVMGDLVGDGPGAALMVGQAMRSMRRLAAQRADLLDFFAHLNDEIRVDLVHGCSMNVFAAVLNLPFNSLTCLSVGFHPVVLVNPKREITLQQIHTRGDPLGVANGQQFRSGLRPLSLQLEAGDVVVMFTDGVARAHNARDLNAGRLAVMGSCVKHLELPCSRMVAAMLDEAKAQCGGRPTDDLSALALRVKHPDEPNSGGFTVVPPVRPASQRLPRRT